MNRLIINTANDELVIVLTKNNKVFSKIIDSKMHHNETMLPAIDELLKENNIEVNNINEFGVVIGPGSFTGIRVGVSTIKAFKDVVGVAAKGINNLDYLYHSAKSEKREIETVAIAGSKDSYFVAKLINGVVYKYERNLTLKELIEVSEGKPVGMFKQDENINCYVVKQNADALIECLNISKDEKLIPVYYQLSQAENEKLKRGEVKIRKACKKDVNNIYDIEKESIHVNTLSKEIFSSAIGDENYMLLKAEYEKEVVGFVLLQKSDELNIDSIAVKKRFRNLGVASKLIAESEKRAKKNKIGALSLEVAYTNITAYLLYKKLGFVNRRIRKKYYADGTDCIEMIKKI